ncbi:hypothetical protein GOP47_0029223 [Adiantum capillus-veneris]|nr:hypothetical protein GOP47_0029223 [Adiantum capillus-veneris]
MVSPTEATTSRMQKEHARCHNSTEEEIDSHGNVAFCQRYLLYASGEELAASTLATLLKKQNLQLLNSRLYEIKRWPFASLSLLEVWLVECHKELWLHFND